MRPQLAVQLVKDDAGLNLRPHSGRVQFEDVGQMARTIDDQPGIDRLAALRGAAAARGDGNAFLAGDRKRGLRRLDGFRRDDPHRHLLVEGGVRRVAAPAEPVEQHVAFDVCAQLALQSRPQVLTHRYPLENGLTSNLH